MKKAGIVLLIIFIALAATYIFVNEKKPKGVQTDKADEIAQRMLKAVNDDAWQKTGAVSWNFKGVHDFIWDRERHYTKVNWDDYEVYVSIHNRIGVAYKNGVELKGEENADAVDKAWKYWVNDSFWLNPISKIFDPGTSRHLVPVEESGMEGMMVTYSSGGATPGDSYLWIVNEEGFPSKWKMWVSIIPVGGIEFTWDRWITTETGAKISTFHDGAIMDIEIQDVKTASSLRELIPGDDPFEILDELNNNTAQ